MMANNSFNVGLLYAFDNGLSLYGNYGSSFQPATQVDRNGDALKHVSSRQFEGGMKYNPTSKNWLLTLAAYHLTEKNAAKYAGSYSAAGSYYEAVGEVASKGFEAQLRGDLGKGSQLFFQRPGTDRKLPKMLVQQI